MALFLSRIDLSTDFVEESIICKNEMLSILLLKEKNY